MRRTLFIIIVAQICCLLCIHANHKLIDTNSQQIQDSKFEIDLSVLDSVVTIWADNVVIGSGVVVDKNLILTAGHCIDEANVKIMLSDNTECKIIFQWKSDKYDIGFIEVKEKLNKVYFGNMPEVFNKIYRVGMPLNIELKESISEGIVSYVGRDLSFRNGLLQLDLSGVVGLSGAPIFNKHNKLVGIHIGSYKPHHISLAESIIHIKECLEEYRATQEG
jgi:S1-C subfamily serine protease